MTDKKIHYLGSEKPFDSKDIHIAKVTNKHIGNIKFEEIAEFLKTIPEIHHPVIEQAVKDRNYELLGATIIMAIYQLAQENITKALYP